MNELMKLVVALTELTKATTELVHKKLGETHQPTLPFTEAQPATEAAPAAEAPKKERKPRAPKEVPAEGNTGANIEDQLGLEAAAPKVEAKKKLTPEESMARVDEVTRQYVRLYKADTPDGKTRAISLMKDTFKVEALRALSLEQQAAWIAEMEKGILEHK